MKFHLKSWTITVDGYVKVLDKATAVIFMVYKLCLDIPNDYIAKIIESFFFLIADIS